jgi:hypothetical protein
MKLDALRAAIREFAQRKQSSWMAGFDSALAEISNEQRAKGKLHTATTAEAYAKGAQKLLSDVGAELATHILELIGPDGKGQLTEREVVAEFAAAMRFGRDRLASKLLKAIEGLGLTNAGEGTEGLARFKKTQSYEPGESKLKVFFSGSTATRGGKPLSEWKPTKVEDERPQGAPTRIWFVVLALCLGIVAFSAIWYVKEFY